MTGDDSGTGHDTHRPGRLCGGKKRGSKGTCRRPAGWGTDHPGRGRCKLHLGATRTHGKAAERQAAEEAVVTFGLPLDVDPRDALLQEVRRSAGHVAWLAALVASLEHGGVGYRRETWVDGDPDDEDAETREVYVPLSGLKQLSRDGKFEKPAVWVELYAAERRHLREVCRDAIGAGLAERQVQLAEQQGAALAGAVRAILSDLGLTGEQWAMVPEIVPRHLRAAIGDGAAGGEARAWPG